LQASSFVPHAEDEVIKLAKMKSLILGERNKLDKIKVLQVEKTDTQSSVDKIKAFSQSATLFVGDQLTCERIAGLIRLMEGEKDYHRFVPPSPTGTRLCFVRVRKLA